MVMTNSATKDDLAALDKKIDERFDDLADLIQSFMVQVDARFNKIEQDIIDLKASHDRLLNTLDAFLKQLTDGRDEQAARDNQFERLLAWARKVSEKTGIPLENL